MREVLETRRDAEYFRRDGLRTLTGLPETLWTAAILKEILDNALDAINDIAIKRVDVVAQGDVLGIYDSGRGEMGEE